MWYAVKIYCIQLQEKGTQADFIKMGSTFFNEAIYEYAMQYRENKEYWESKMTEENSEQVSGD